MAAEPRKPIVMPKLTKTKRTQLQKIRGTGARVRRIQDRYMGRWVPDARRKIERTESNLGIRPYNPKTRRYDYTPYSLWERLAKEDADLYTIEKQEDLNAFFREFLKSDEGRKSEAVRKWREAEKRTVEDIFHIRVERNRVRMDAENRQGSLRKPKGMRRFYLNKGMQEELDRLEDERRAITIRNDAEKSEPYRQIRREFQAWYKAKMLDERRQAKT